MGDMAKKPDDASYCSDDDCDEEDSSSLEISVDGAARDLAAFDNRESNDGEYMVFLGDLAHCVMNHSRMVIIIWIALTLLCVPGAIKFTDILQIKVNSPPGSGSELADKAFREYFPPAGLAARYIGYLETDRDSITDIPDMDRFCRTLLLRLDESRALTSFMSPTTYKDLTHPVGSKAPAMPVPMVSADKKSMLIAWQTDDDPTGKGAIEWSTGAMNDIFMKLVPEMLGDAITFYGTDSYAQADAQAVPVAEADMARVDLICIPITAGVLLLLVKSLRLLIIPAFTFGISACISFAIMYVIGCFITVMAVTPGLMQCLMISVSIDYAIFILMRFREELPDKSAPDESGDEGSDGATDVSDLMDARIAAAISKTMSTSGATILYSGAVLFASFLFLAFFPIQMLASMGMGACIGMALMILVNLTLVPALLFEFRTFFTYGLTKKVEGWSDDFWRCLASAVTKKPWNVISLLIVFVCSLAVSYPVLDLQTSGSIDQILGMHTRLGKVSHQVGSRFGGGFAFPIEVVLVPEDSSTPILSEKFFRDSSSYLEALETEVKTQLPEAGTTKFNFLTFQTEREKPVDFKDLDALCLITEHSRSPIRRFVERLGVRAWTAAEDLSPMCSFFIDVPTNTHNYRQDPPTALYGVIIPGVEPMGTLGQKFLQILRDAEKVHGPRFGVKSWFGGDAVKNLDMITSVYSTFPKAMIATVVTAAVFLLITFRSVVVPIRCLLGNLLTLGVTYGFTVMTYQYGVLDFLNASGVNGKFKSLPWCAPVVVFFIVFGIGLDYDIFLLVRITELRAKGMAPTAAVHEGLVSTGGIITAAGLVMVCAFSGVLFSSMFQQAMFGFMISTAVLYDTFIARSIVTPAGMSLLGYFNWWPSQLSVQDDERADSRSLASDDEFALE